MSQLHNENESLTNRYLRASEVSTGEYARRLLVADQLAGLGCKWPILHEHLSLRATDAQKIMSESSPQGFSMARLETGTSWFKKSGDKNIRMLHASYFYHIYTIAQSNWPEATDVEILLYAYRQYCALITPILDNINRAWYLISSIKLNRSFKIHTCSQCSNEYVAFKNAESTVCPACERNQFIHCSRCSQLIDQPYAPGKNGNRRTCCTSCADKIRKEKRKLRDRRKQVYIASAVLR